MLAEQGQELLEHFGVALARLRKRSTERRIHRLRIRTKKLRSLFRMIRAMVPDAATPPKGAHGRLKALFHAAGRQREVQVSVRLVDKLAGVSARDRKTYRDHLTNRSNKAARDLDKVLASLKDRDMERLGSYIEQVTDGLVRTRERQGARNYIDVQLKEAGRALRAGEPAVALHDVRKHIKNAWHTLRVMADAEALYVRQKELMERLAVVQQNLGNWHDVHVLLADLEKWKGGGAVRERLRQAGVKELQRGETKVLEELSKVPGLRTGSA